MARLAVSVVVPVLNEEQSIGPLLESLFAQTRLPDEVVIVDAGSSDGTVQLIEAQVRFGRPVRLLRAPRAYPGTARNAGVEAAAHEVIAFTDAGIRLDVRWLEQLLRPLETDPGADVVYGTYEPVTASAFTECAALTYVPARIERDGRWLRAPFLASSAMRRHVWRAAGGFPPHRASEDLAFMERVEQGGHRIVYAPDAIAHWQLPPDVRSTFRRFATYSRHNLRAGRGRYWHAGVARFYLVCAGFLALAAVAHPLWGLAPVAALAARTVKTIFGKRRAFAFNGVFRPARALAVSGLILLLDAATIWGALVWACADAGRGPRPRDTKMRAAAKTAPVSTLYISSDGILEPLGESQILSYLEGLAPDHDITLLSFEKAGDLHDAGRFAQMERRLGTLGIRWIPLRYHRRPQVISTAFDVARGTWHSWRWARRRRGALVHARGYVAALIGRILKQATGARLLFDMRGFWPDEKVDGGHWRRGSWLYRTTKQCERDFIESADGIVTLTHEAAALVTRLGYRIGPDTPIEVITTCADLTRFAPGPKDPALVSRLGLAGWQVIGCSGTISNWYLRREMLDALACLLRALPRTKVLAVTREDHGRLRQDAAASGMDLERLTVTSARFDEMPAYLRLMDAGFYFLKPTFSKQGSSATKLGEFLASGVPVVINDKVGDSGRLVRWHHAGIVLPTASLADVQAAVPEIDALLSDPGARIRARHAAEASFNLTDGIQAYASLYRRLTNRETPMTVPVAESVLT